MKLAVLPLFTALLLVPLSGCLEGLAVDERYGHLLNPAEVDDCPVGCVPYVTVENDSLAMLAKRAYGRVYKLYLIAALPENKEILEAATKSNGLLEKGKIIFFPPDIDGRMIDRQTLRRTQYFGGIS
jgi:hypothetical protein